MSHSSIRSLRSVAAAGLAGCALTLCGTPAQALAAGGRAPHATRGTAVAQHAGGLRTGAQARVVRRVVQTHC
jgi:hypothetical protein